MTRVRHLRRYYVRGRTGDGSVVDLAALGLDPSSPSVSKITEGESTLVGVRRAFTITSPEAIASFGVR